MKFIVSDLPEVPEEYKRELNINDFWDAVSMEMIGRGFTSSEFKYYTVDLNLLLIHWTEISV